MVDHHHLETHRSRRRDRLVGRGAAVHRHHQFGPLILEPPKGGGAWAIAFDQAVGDIDRQVRAHGPEPAHQKRGAGRAVDIIVGEHGHGPLALQRIHQDLGGPVHVHERRRIWEQGLQGGIEEMLGRVRRYLPGRERASQGLGEPEVQLMAADSVGVCGALAPDASGERASDAQEPGHGRAVGHLSRRALRAPDEPCRSRNPSPGSGCGRSRPPPSPRRAERPWSRPSPRRWPVPAPSRAGRTSCRSR